MLFNSLEFLLFLPTVFVLYWFLFKNQLRAQNILLLVASYVFYGWWDYRFLSLIIFSTIVDYLVALRMQQTDKNQTRKFLLFISIGINLGLLGFFKYFNFFIESWVHAWNAFGVTMQSSTLQIILPVGISFYTFQTLSYTIDVYRKQLTPTKNFIDFAAFVTFFPQLVAGPIERASNLLPQFQKNRNFDFENAKSGVQLIIWGLFKKVVIADSCAVYVNVIFGDYQNMNSLTLILGAVYFAFQIYGDFSGYSDMAIGISKLFGFDLMRNFNYPYFSRDIAEFWRRWHISLSTWFRDYLYIPLGGSKGNKWQQVRNVFVIFLVSGFWHGANWTFIAWGFLNALYFLPLLLLNKNRSNIGEVVVNLNKKGIKDLINIASTFILTCFAWIFFRAESIQMAIAYCAKLINDFSFKIEYLAHERYNVELLLILAMFVWFEWINRKTWNPIQNDKYLLRTTIIILLMLALGVFSNHMNFIYFQF